MWYLDICEFRHEDVSRCRVQGRKFVEQVWEAHQGAQQDLSLHPWSLGERPRKEKDKSN